MASVDRPERRLSLQRSDRPGVVATTAGSQSACWSSRSHAGRSGGVLVRDGSGGGDRDRWGRLHGQAITESDLREVSLSGGDGLATIAVADAEQVVGRTAAVSLSKGALLTGAQLTDGAALPEGSVITGAVLAPGQYPVGLAVGDTVDVVETTAPDTSGIGEPVSRGSASVLDLADSIDGQGLLTVSLAIAADDAAAISSAGAAGHVSLVVTPS